MDNKKLFWGYVKLSDSEEKLALEFFETHECEIRYKYQGAISGPNKIVIGMTSIGVMLSASCSCGKSCLLNGDDL